MVFPIGDAPNPRGVPAVTYLLIAANVAVYVLVTLPLEQVRPAATDPALAEYVRVVSEAVRNQAELRRALAQVSQYDLFVFLHGFRPAAPSVADLFSSMFLHGGFLHLAGNMLFLWIYGDNVEHRLGGARYLLWYLGCGVAAALFQWAASPESPLPMVGASGAISGMLGFYFLWFPRNQVRLLWLLPPFVMHVFEIPARIVLGIYLVADNLLPFLLGGGLGGVAHGAHIGGFLAGLGVAWLSDRRVLRGALPGFAGGARPSGGAGAIATALADGHMEEAAAAYFALSPGASRGVLTPDESLALASWLREQGHDDAALTVLRRHVRDFPVGPGLAEAHVAAGEIELEHQRQPTPAYQHFLAALDVGPAAEVAARARLGIAAVERLQKRQVGHLHPRHVR